MTGCTSTVLLYTNTNQQPHLSSVPGAQIMLNSNSYFFNEPNSQYIVKLYHDLSSPVHLHHKSLECCGAGQKD